MQLIKAQTSNYSIESFCGGGKTTDLAACEGKITIPKSLQEHAVYWCYTALWHPGEARVEHTMRQHLHWKHLREDVHRTCGTCPTCQKNKKHSAKCRHLPAKDAETCPWETLCVDLIGPHAFKRTGKPDPSLWCVIMTNPATGWLKLLRCLPKQAQRWQT